MTVLYAARAVGDEVVPLGRAREGSVPAVKFLPLSGRLAMLFSSTTCPSDEVSDSRSGVASVMVISVVAVPTAS